MNHRWQQMVMIVTSSIIIVLLSYDHLQQQKKLREDNQGLSSPIEIPSGFLWPDELREYQSQVEQRQGESSERSTLLEKARSYNIDLDSSESLEVWRKKIQEVENKSLVETVRSSYLKNKIQSPYAPLSLEERPRLWNLALVGFQSVEVQKMYVMKYELTQASSWFLGYSKTPLLEECPFCSVEISYEDSHKLADRLSESMSLTPCYKNNVAIDVCHGWRLPSKEEWENVRGGDSQKWSYMIAPPEEESGAQPTGMHAPNVHDIHDIVGHFAEWTQEKETIGYTFLGDVPQDARVGVRFYRTQNQVLP